MKKSIKAIAAGNSSSPIAQEARQVELDAARYRWLRATQNTDIRWDEDGSVEGLVEDIYVSEGNGRAHAPSPDELDALIDAAMEKNGVDARHETTSPDLEKDLIAYAFRFPNGKDTWYGIAIARNEVEMFWKIDEHGDPTAAEIATLPYGSCCWKFDEEGLDRSIVQTELSESVAGFGLCFDDLEWRKPDWTDVCTPLYKLLFGEE